jgi:manganese oxidase
MKNTHLVRSAVRCLLAAALGWSALPGQAAVEGSWGNGTATRNTAQPRSFDLYTGEGHISMADGNQVYMWGYTEDASKPMQYPGPTLKMRVGETINITLHNRLPVGTSLLFPGQVMSAGGAANNGLEMLAATAGAAGSLRAGNPGDVQTYSFTASQPGTYLYQSGSNPSLQVEMGLMGAIVVYPADANGGLKNAYGHPGTAFDRENLQVVSEMDSRLHAQVDERMASLRQVNAACLTGTIPLQGCTAAIGVDLSTRFPDYWLFNGRTSPDVFARNYAEHLPLQPYNTVPRLHPGEKILLRMVNGGTDMHPLHHHGNNSWAIARDGRLLSTQATVPGVPPTPTDAGPNLAVSDFTIQTVPGQTYDAIWSWNGKGIGWDVFGATCDAGQPVSPANCRFGKFNAAGVQTAAAAAIPGGGGALFKSTQSPITDMYKPIPVTLPSELELAYGEFYSGSPYLGDFGLRPVGAGAANTTGAYFHIFHSHNERELVNGGVFPGGMMTMLVIEPFNITIEATNP